ncbi:MAG: hypothetical protein SFW36_21510 [Leptolyngbyaceae cyanobacterium bins.59]|nr:hypothetical protein [Leptolyngbyaceae cyanobacterium bins.59]
MRYNLFLLACLLFMGGLVSYPSRNTQSFTSDPSQLVARQSLTTLAHRHRSLGRVYRGSGRRAILS